MGLFSKSGNVDSGKYSGKHAKGYQQASGKKGVKTGGKIVATGRHRADKSGGKGGFYSGAKGGNDRWG